MTRTTININDTVEVTLTEEGAAHLNATRAAFYAQYPHLSVSPQVTPGQLYSAQLWDLMRDFGPIMGAGMPEPFKRCEMVMESSPEVRIVDKDNPETWPPNTDRLIVCWYEGSQEPTICNALSQQNRYLFSDGTYVAWMSVPIVPGA